jgi:hypothetical protein
MGDQSEAHSFVLRIWLEDPPTGEDSARWRGRITNVLDERSRAVQDFHQVEEFVKEYVQQWDEPRPVT